MQFYLCWWQYDGQLSILHAFFKKSTIGNVPLTNCYLNNILSASKGKFSAQKYIVIKILAILDGYNFANKELNYKTFQKESERLGFKVIDNGVTQLIDKFLAIKNFPIPKKMKDLRSFFGSTIQNTNFVFNFATLGSPLRPLLKKKSKF